jgi:PAS domain S-box-containing protein
MVKKVRKPSTKQKSKNIRLLDTLQSKTLQAENKRLKKELLQLETLKKTSLAQTKLLNSAGVLLSLIDKEYRYFIINDEWCRVAGKSRKKIIGKKSSMFWDRKDFSKEIKPKIDDAFKGKTIHCQHWLKNVDGEKFCLDICFRPYYNNNSIEGVFITAFDITDRKKAEEILIVSEHRNRSMVNAIPDMMFCINYDGIFLDYKANTNDKLYVPPEVFLGKKMADLLPPDIVGKCTNALKRMVETKTLQTFEYQLTIDEELFYFEARVVANPDADEAIFIIRDITKRKQAEEMRKVSEEKYRSLFENMLNGFMYCKVILEYGKPVDFIFLEVNKSFESLTGLKNVIGKKGSEIIPGIRKYDPQMFEAYDRVVLTGKPEIFETYIRAMNIWVSVSIFSPQKEYCIAIFDVITERIIAEKDLEFERKRLRTLVETMPDIVVLKDTSGVYLLCNPEYEKFYGKRESELVGKTDYDFVDKEKADKYKNIDSDVLRNNKSVVIKEEIVYASDGHKAVVELIKTPIIGSTGKTIGILTIGRNITEQTEYANQFKKERDYVVNILESMSDAFVALDDNWCYTYMNEKAGLIFNRNPKEMIGKHIWTEFPEGIGQPFHLAYDKAMREKIFVTLEEYYPPYNKWFENYINPIDNGLIIFFKDVTERKKAELKIENERKRLQTLVETIPDPVFLKDPNGVYLLCNHAYEMLFGIKVLDIIGKTDYDVVPQEVADKFRKNDLDVLKENKSIIFFEEVKFSGSERKAFFESSKTPMYDAEGKLVGVLGVAREITKLMETNKALEESEAKLKEAQCIAKVGRWEINLSTNHLIWSDESYNIFEMNKDKSALSYDIFLDAIHPDDRETVNNTYTSSVKNKAPFDIIYRISMTDGRIKYVNEKGRMKYDESNIPIGIIGTVQDITDQKLISIALHESESRYRILFEQNPAPMLIYERDTLKMLATNEAFNKHYGYSQEETLAMRLPDLYPPEEKESIAKLALDLHGYQDVGEWHHKRKDGSFISIIARSNDLLYESHVARVAVLSDVTERKLAEEKIRTINIELEEQVSKRTEQLAAANKDLESFAYSISHDLRAPLRHIDGFSRLLKNNMAQESEETIRYCNKITESSTKMASMIDALLAFSKLGRKSLQKTEINLNQLVNNVIKHFEPDIENRNIEWHVGDLPTFYGDFNLMQLVFENLISNAIKFTSKKEKAIIEIEKYNIPGSRCGFYIKDNGAGFDMAYADKLFGVFQRLHTKEEFEGTGIGLANIKQIIQKHGGTIRAEGEVNKGTTFYITFNGE